MENKTNKRSEQFTDLFNEVRLIINLDIPDEVVSYSFYKAIIIVVFEVIKLKLKSEDEAAFQRYLEFVIPCFYQHTSNRDTDKWEYVHLKSLGEKNVDKDSQVLNDDVQRSLKELIDATFRLWEGQKSTDIFDGFLLWLENQSVTFRQLRPIVDDWLLYRMKVFSLLSDLIPEACTVVQHYPIGGQVRRALKDSHHFIPIHYRIRNYNDEQRYYAKERKRGTNEGPSDFIFQGPHLHAPDPHQDFTSCFEKLVHCFCPATAFKDQYGSLSLSLIEDITELVNRSDLTGGAYEDGFEIPELLAHIEASRMRRLDLKKVDDLEEQISGAWRDWSNVGNLLEANDIGLVVASEDYFTYPESLSKHSLALRNKKLISKVIKLPHVYGDKTSSLYLMVLKNSSTDFLGIQFVDYSRREHETQDMIELSTELLASSISDGVGSSWWKREHDNGDALIDCPTDSLVLDNLSVNNHVWFSEDNPEEISFLKAQKSFPRAINSEFTTGKRFYELKNDSVDCFYPGAGSEDTYLAFAIVDDNSMWPTVIGQKDAELFRSDEVRYIEVNTELFYPPYLALCLQSDTAKKHLGKLYEGIGIWDKPWYSSMSGVWDKVNYLQTLKIPKKPIGEQRKIVEEALREKVVQKEMEVVLEKVKSAERELELTRSLCHDGSRLVGKLVTTARRLRQSTEASEKPIQGHSEEISSTARELETIFERYGGFASGLRGTVKKSEFELVTYLKQKCSGFQYQEFGEEYNKILKIYYEGPEQLLVNSDADILWWIMENILHNSCRHGGVEKESFGRAIRIEVQEGSENAMITISDNGAGPAKEFSPEKYFQFGERSGINKGAGLGGRIIRMLSEKLGGNVRVGVFQSRKAKERRNNAAHKGDASSLDEIAYLLASHELENPELDDTFGIPDHMMKSYEMPTMLKGDLPERFLKNEWYGDGFFYWGEVGFSVQLSIPIR